MNVAIELVADYLASTGKNRQLALLRDAEAHPQRIINTTGNEVLEGVSVVFALARRAQLIVDVEAANTGTGAFTRAEASVEAITLSTPSTGTAVWPSAVPAIPGTSQLAYIQIPAEELQLLTGADVFLPALQDALITRAQLALTPQSPPEVLP